MVTYASPAGFLGAPLHGREAAGVTKPRFAVAGVPYDGAVTNRPGARFGPAAIRAASRMLCDAVHPLFECSPREALVDAGDLQLPVTSIAAQRAALQAAAAPLIGAYQVCWLGGDHSITLPLLRAYRAALGRALAIVHFDAHCDTWADHFGEPSGHGTWMREAIVEGLVVPAATIQIGLRSPGHAQVLRYVENAGGCIFTARQMRGRESIETLAPLVQEIRRRIEAAGSPPVYLTLDIDCLDPAFAPGTGTPEPGGLCSAQVLALIEELADLPWVGMDCVEDAPAYDHAEITSLVAAHLVWTFLCGRIAAARSGGRQ
jgi:agmatinase